MLAQSHHQVECRSNFWSQPNLESEKLGVSLENSLETHSLVLWAQLYLLVLTLSWIRLNSLDPISR